DDAGGRFAIDGDKLRVAKVLDHEMAVSHSVKIKVTDQTGNAYSEMVTITVGNVAEAPASIALSSTSVVENSGAGTIVGTLSGTDPDDGQSATLVFSLKDTSSQFEIVGNELRVKAGGLIDFEAAASHPITIIATDGDGLKTEKSFAVAV